MKGSRGEVARRYVDRIRENIFAAGSCIQDDSNECGVEYVVDRDVGIGSEDEARQTEQKKDCRKCKKRDGDR